VGLTRWSRQLSIPLQPDHSLNMTRITDMGISGCDPWTTDPTPRGHQSPVLEWWIGRRAHDMLRAAPQYPTRKATATVLCHQCRAQTVKYVWYSEDMSGGPATGSSDLVGRENVRAIP